MNFEVGMKVRFQPGMKISLPIEGDKEYIVIEVEEVPKDVIEYDPVTTGGGVGHHQWVIINDEQKTRYSGLFFDPDKAKKNS